MRQFWLRTSNILKSRHFAAHRVILFLRQRTVNDFVKSEFYLPFESKKTCRLGTKKLAPRVTENTLRLHYKQQTELCKTNKDSMDETHYSTLKWLVHTATTVTYMVYVLIRSATKRVYDKLLHCPACFIPKITPTTLHTVSSQVRFNISC